MEAAIASSPDHPILIDKFLAHATEVDVDAISDGVTVVVGGLMEHIEMAGVHSGDSACSLPPWSLDQATQNEIKRQTEALALELGVRGLMNVQFAVEDGVIYVLEVNPRASRTVPFVSKATGVPLAKYAARVMAGETLHSIGFTEQPLPDYMSVKEAVLPFIKFPGVDTLLGPEMKSTGEVMGIGRRFGVAFAKAERAAGTRLPSSGAALLSVREEDREALEAIGKGLVGNGITLLGTAGTAEFLNAKGIACESVNKVREGSPHTVDAMIAGRVSMVINTCGTPQSVKDSFSIRRTALEMDIPYFTTMAAASAAVEGITLLGDANRKARALQDFHSGEWS
jgi:carbamoyl-phosphate synthase large subunit